MTRVLGCCIFTVRIGAVCGRDNRRSLLILFVVIIVGAATRGIVTVSTVGIRKHSRISMIALAFVETWTLSLIHALLVPIDRTSCIATIHRAGVLVRDLIAYKMAG